MVGMSLRLDRPFMSSRLTLPDLAFQVLRRR
jgi:hypothetical protein